MENLYLPISMALGLIVCGLAARWYVWPALSRLSLIDALTPLLLLHATRYVGLAFLLPGVTATALDPRFALPAAYGDLLAALLALLALAALRLNWGWAAALVWVFNLFGAADLVNAVFQGLRFTADGDLGATYFIPTVIVPALLVTHYLILRLQLQAMRDKSAARGVAHRRGNEQIA